MANTGIYLNYKTLEINNYGNGTIRVLMLITGFYGKSGLEEVLDQLASLLSKYCACTQIESGYIEKQKK
jgi:hypothetical protein